MDRSNALKIHGSATVKDYFTAKENICNTI